MIKALLETQLIDETIKNSEGKTFEDLRIVVPPAPVQELETVDEQPEHAPQQDEQIPVSSSTQASEQETKDAQAE